MRSCVDVAFINQAAASCEIMMSDVDVDLIIVDVELLVQIAECCEVIRSDINAEPIIRAAEYCEVIRSYVVELIIQAAEYCEVMRSLVDVELSSRDCEDVVTYVTRPPHPHSG
jgi:hypothetical protein